MRVTNAMIMSNFQDSLTDNLSSLNDSYKQMSSERKFSRASDDPVSAMKALKSLHTLNDLAQNAESIQDSQSWIQNTESTVDTVNSIIKSAKEKLLAANNTATVSASDRQIYAGDLSQIQNELVQTLNTTFNGQYVFGGATSGSAPFKVGTTADDGAANNGKLMIYNYTDSKYEAFTSVTSSTKGNYSLSMPVDVGLGMKVDASGKIVVGTTVDNSASGVDLLAFDMSSTGCGDLYDTLSGAITKLTAPTSSDLSGELADTEKALDSALQTDVTLGSKSNFLTFLADKNTDQNLNVTTKLSSLEDVNLAQAIMNYEQKDAVYNASLSVGTKISSMSVVDFLK